MDFTSITESIIDQIRDDWSMLVTDDDPQILTEWMNALQLITETFVDKNADYGTKNIASAWTTGVVVRLGDKVSRLWNLVLNNHENRVDEAITDTLLDVAAYAIIGYLMSTGQWERAEIDETIGLEALIRYWIANNDLTEQETDGIMSLLVATEMIKDGFPGKLKE